MVRRSTSHSASGGSAGTACEVDGIRALIAAVDVCVYGATPSGTAASFEHSITNIYFIPIALFLRGDAHVLERVGPPMERLAQLAWAGFFLDNLIPVTLGNMVGGVMMVAAVYWCVYLWEKPGNQVIWTWQHLTHALVEPGRATNDHGETLHDRSQSFIYRPW
jgi:hypothetical protein